MFTSTQETEFPEKVISDWFDGFISNIKVDRIMMETGRAPKEIKQVYDSAIKADDEGVVSGMRIWTSTIYISQIVKDYFKELSAYKANPLKLAFDFSDAKVLVWAEIKAGDDSTEDALILSEAKANEKYSSNGFFISSTIVEDCDNFSVPPHYRQVPINGRLFGAS